MNKEQTEMQEREIEFLKQLHQTAQMGRETLEHVNCNIGPSTLRKAVEKDIFDYSEVCAEVSRKLEERQADAKPVGKISRAMAGMMIDVKIKDDTPDKEIAKMIIDGTTKGITECVQKLGEFSDVDNDVKNVCYKLLWIQQKNIDEMKAFLY